MLVAETKALNSNIDKQDPSGAWNAFFSSLAWAEKAAAEQCRIIAKELAVLGETALSKGYLELATEEDSHFRLASGACKSMVMPPERAQQAYRGEYLSPSCHLVERMACVHLVFEPAALAFLGFMHQEAHNLIAESEWSEKIAEHFAEILRDEVSHVYEGREIVRKFWRNASPAVKRDTLKSMRRHRAFLKAGLPSFFRDYPGAEKFTGPMLTKFDFYFRKSAQGVTDETKKVAS